MAGTASRRLDATRGLLLGLALSWLLSVPFCPADVAQALPGGAAPLFAGALMLGCAAACGAAAARGRASRAPGSDKLPRALRWLLPAGTACVLLWSGLGLPGGGAAAAASGLAAGTGEACVLLMWGRGAGRLPAPRLLAMLAIACGASGAFALALDALSWSPAAVRAALFGLSLACMAAPRGPRMQPAPKKVARPGAALAPMLGRMWEPLLGLALSLMSAMLPWGSLVESGSASVPPAWSFGAGVLLLGTAALLAARTLPGRVDFDTAIHVSVPLLAAAVVGLRLVGDSSDAATLVSAPKGLLSGAAGAGFLVCGWLAMGHESRRLGDLAPGGPADRDALPADPALPFALGLCCVCLVGFAILPAHAVSQQAASLAAPFLSLAFLAASSGSSIVHMRRRAGESQQAARPMGVEEAARALARERGLSPRETQVLGQLVLGRSAEGIGAVLGISPNTVRSHIGNIHGKLGVQSRDQLADLIEQTQQAHASQNSSSEVK